LLHQLPRLGRYRSSSDFVQGGITMATATRPNDTTKRRGCFCSHCRRDGFHRREMTITPSGYWLCSACDGLTTARESTAMRAASNEYWDKIKPHLRIVDDGGADPASAPAGPTASAPPKARPKRSRAFRQWQLDVLAARDLSGEVKIVLLRLAMYADWTTGANAWPCLDVLAAAIGRSPKQLRRLLADPTVLAWVTVERRRLRGRQTSNAYHFCWPDGRTVAAETTRVAAVPEEVSA
jgi:hypothetical protein